MSTCEGCVWVISLIMLLFEISVDVISWFIIAWSEVSFVLVYQRFHEGNQFMAIRRPLLEQSLEFRKRDFS